MLRKRKRASLSAGSTATLALATPAKRKGCAIDNSAPRTRKRRHLATDNFPHTAHFADLRHDCSTASYRNYRAQSVDPPTLSRLCNSSPQPLERQRARSVDYSPPILRLTQENLRRLEDSFQSSLMSFPRNPSPTRKDTAITEKRQLAAYNITVDKEIPLPGVLGDFVETLRRTREEEPSPHAQTITGKRRAALVENEITARKMMEEHILFRGEGHSDGIKCLTLKDQVNLVKDYFPTPPRITVPELWGSLARPQPDSCIGYITATEATTHTPAFAMPFTRLEDDMADWLNVVHNAETHFPFLTGQWKAAMSGENQVHASLQAARDGALIVNYMYHFYSLAYPNQPPTQLQTCHFSVTTEGYTIILWIHWREVDPEDGQVYTRMEQVEMARMRELQDLLDLRKLLHNYLDFALGERLASIKKALPSFWQNRPQKKTKRTKSQTSTTLSGSDLRLAMPKSPLSSLGDGTSRPVSPSKRKLADLSQD